MRVLNLSPENGIIKERMNAQYGRRNDDVAVIIEASAATVTNPMCCRPLSTKSVTTETLRVEKSFPIYLTRFATQSEEKFADLWKC